MNTLEILTQKVKIEQHKITGIFLWKILTKDGIKEGWASTKTDAILLAASEVISAAVVAAKDDSERLRFLDALMECGVDNWSGWGDANDYYEGVSE